MKKFEELKKLIAAMQEDADKFYVKGNSAAGTRLRKSMQELKSFAQQIRDEVQQVKNKMNEDSSDDEKDQANGGGPRRTQ